MLDLLTADHALTGGAALISALALLVHALRAAIPDVVRALAARADAARLDAETRAHAQRDHELTVSDLRSRLDACDEAHRATQADMRVLREELAVVHDERAALAAQLSALREELDTVRRSIASSGHVAPVRPRKD